MKFFVDTEFLQYRRIEHGNYKPIIDPISIALVCENDAEYYAQNSEALFIESDAFVRQHVQPSLVGFPNCTGGKFWAWQHLKDCGPGCFWRDRDTMRYEIRQFVDEQCSASNQQAVPEFWGDYSAYDFVILSQLFDSFENWPEGWPFYMRDLQQYQQFLKMDAPAASSNHNALDDARTIKKQWEWLQKQTQQ